MHKKLGDDYAIVYHGHHLSKMLEKASPEVRSFFIDKTDTDDVNELMLSADALVTDYSSIMFDFMILERPCFCFAPDYEEFSVSRGLLFDLNGEIPYGAIKNTNEICDAILAQRNNFDDKYRSFFAKYVQRGPDATSQIIDEMKRRGVLD